MQTQIISITATRPDWSLLKPAVSALHAGDLVAFPTETVYGLGAHALDADAVAKIYAVKGRPSRNPIIVHVADIASAKNLTTGWTDECDLLAKSFWPGSLTLVLPKNEKIPDVVCAGGSTVGIRIPAHPVALRLLQDSGLPIAAPSANLSNQLSPTTAQHVFQDLNGKIPWIIDGGACQGGLESTVIDMTQNPLRLLRPGLVTVNELRNVIGEVAVRGQEQKGQDELRSPGQLAIHYAPKTPLECHRGDATSRVKELTENNSRVGWVRFHYQGVVEVPNAITIDMPKDAPSYASQLYAMLHDLDAQDLDRIVVELPPSTEEWRAIHDRLRRAAMK